MKRVVSKVEVYECCSQCVDCACYACSVSLQKSRQEESDAVQRSDLHGGCSYSCICVSPSLILLQSFQGFLTLL